MLQFQLHVSAYPLSERMRFLAVELVIRFLEPVRGIRQSAAGRSTGDFKTAKSVLDEAYREARAGLKFKLGAPLGQHLQATLAKVVETWKAFAARASPKLAQKVNEALAKLASEVEAHQCGCQHDDLCIGLLLPEGPRPTIVPVCIRSLHSMAELAVTFTRNIYEHHIPELSHPIEVDINFRGTNSRANRVTGRTEFVRPRNRFALSGPARPVWVELDVPVAQLDSDSYFSIIYVIAHELAVHAAQELGRASPPVPPLQHVAFPEGLIDRVIYEELVGAISSDKKFQSVKRAIGPIERFHASRPDEQERDASYWSYDLNMGREAYMFLVSVGNFVTRTTAVSRKNPRSGRDWAHATALKLNLLALNETARQQIAERMGEQWNFEGDLPTSRDDLEVFRQTPLGRMVEALADFEGDEDPEAQVLLQVLEGMP